MSEEPKRVPLFPEGTDPSGPQEQSGSPRRDDRGAATAGSLASAPHGAGTPQEPLAGDDVPREPPIGMRTPPPPRKGMGPWPILVVLLLLGAAGWYFFGRPQPAPVVTAASAPAPVAEPASAVAAAPAPSEPAIQHPIEPVAGKPAPVLPTLDTSDPLIKKALADWLGEKIVGSLLRSDDFVRRTVVTVDNLGRDHAAPRLWPLNPALGRFAVRSEGGLESVAAENAARYQPVVSLATSIDPSRAAALYREHYPLFQSAYRELGYPGRYFNDRLVEVINTMLATPEPPQPLAVKQVQIKGELASMQTQPFYDFADPKLESRPAGQKLLLRMGDENARKLKAQLRVFRAAITKSPPPKS